MHHKIWLPLVLFMLSGNCQPTPHWKYRLTSVPGGYLTEVIFGNYKKAGYYYEDKSGAIDLQHPIAMVELADGLVPQWKMVSDSSSITLYYFEQEFSKEGRSKIQNVLHVYKNNVDNKKILFSKTSRKEYENMKYAKSAHSMCMFDRMRFSNRD